MLSSLSPFHTFPTIKEQFILPFNVLTIEEQCALPFNVSQSALAALQKHYKKIQKTNQAEHQELFTYSHGY